MSPYLVDPEPQELPSATIGDLLAGVMTLAERGPEKSSRPDEPINDVTPERVRELRAMQYEDYLQTPEWKHVIAVIGRVVDGVCELCKEPRRWLDVHHLTYERRGQEWGSDLLALCRPCHYMTHWRLGAV